MNTPSGKLPSPRRVLLAVGGGIAAYKAAELVRRLQDAGAEVRVAMTAAAQHFVAPLTFQALSGHPVHTTLLSAQAESGMGHIELARWANLLLVAPATADLLARLAHGLGDDIVTATWLATRAQRAVAPAMNSGMWEHPATARNLAQLRADGVRVWGPASGSQACGEVGEGRLLDPAELVTHCVALWAQAQEGEPAGVRPESLAGLRVVVSAGPTLEDIDPARYLGNRSSGRMGYALAQAAVQAGARVTLVSGPVTLAPPPGATLVQVRSAQQMHAAVLDAARGADVYIGAAAVADYRPQAPRTDKLKKGDDPITLTLVPNPDILRDVAALRPRPFVVGFAAETQDLARYARDKLTRKGADLIAANLVGEGVGFDAPDNALLVVWSGGEQALGPAPKTTLAAQLLALIAERRLATHRP